MELTRNVSTISQKLGIVRLPPKPKIGKELLKIDIWRQILLVNVDIKNGSKALAIRLEKVPRNTVHSDQVGFVSQKMICRRIHTYSRIQ